MRHSNKLFPAVAVIATLVMTDAADAQIRSAAGVHSAGHSSSAQAERVARASWTPTRRSRRTVVVPANGSPADRAASDSAADSNRRHPSDSNRQGVAAPIRLADHRVPMPQNRPVRQLRPMPAAGSGLPTAPLTDPPIVGSGLQRTQHSAGHSHATIAPPILDGQIIAPNSSSIVIEDPVHIMGGGPHGGDVHSAGCGCGDVGCDGGCDSGFCDSGFCDTGACDSGGCDGGCDSMGRGGCCSMCGELCSPNAWRPCVTLCLPQDGWFSAEYLYWFQDGMSLPPLITQSLDPGVSQNQAGVLGAPTTRTIFGGDDVLDDGTDGFRLRFGVWLNRQHTWGVGAEYFNLGSESETFSASGDGAPVLARPLINVNNGSIEESELVSFPGVVRGTVAARVQSELTGAGFNFRWLRGCDQGCSPFLWCSCPTEYCTRSELLYGYRFLELEESVSITENLQSTLSNAPGRFAIRDSFETRNQFNGFDLGWFYRNVRGYWTFDSTIRLALGNNKQTVRINGSTDITGSGGGDGSFDTGILAGPGNSGQFSQNEFAVVPEFGANLGYQLTDQVRVFGGYTFLYMSNVVRPGQHIDRRVNTDLFAPAVGTDAGNFPAFAFDTTDYWVQGVNAGVELRW